MLLLRCCCCCIAAAAAAVAAVAAALLPLLVHWRQRERNSGKPDCVFRRLLLWRGSQRGFLSFFFCFWAVSPKEFAFARQREGERNTEKSECVFPTRSFFGVVHAADFSYVYIVGRFHFSLFSFHFHVFPFFCFSCCFHFFFSFSFLFSFFSFLGISSACLLGFTRPRAARHRKKTQIRSDAESDWEKPKRPEKKHLATKKNPCSL